MRNKNKAAICLVVLAALATLIFYFTQDSGGGGFMSVDPYCMDTDDGNDPYIAGYLMADTVNYYDNCRDSLYLEEQVCGVHPNTGLPNPDFKLVYCEFGCKRVVGGPDRCLTGCVDSDGSNYFVHGTVTVSSKTPGTYNDACLDSNTLKEYSCYVASSGDGKMVSFSYDCPVSCSEGVCVGYASTTLDGGFSGGGEDNTWIYLGIGGGLAAVLAGIGGFIVIRIL